jgi:DNA polymerase-3 subunit epsilon
VWRRIFGLSRRNSRFPANTPIGSQRYVVVDTELTSLDKRSNRVLSIGAVAMEGAKILLAEQFYREVNPGVTIPSETVLIHRLRPADVQNAEDPKQALLDLKQFAEGAVLVGHFVSIDIHALQKELGGHGHELDNPFIDTAKVHRWLLRHSQYAEDLGHRYEQVDLLSLANHYKLPVQDLHHALADAFLTAQLWQKLIFAAEKQGIHKVGELLNIGG